MKSIDLPIEFLAILQNEGVSLQTEGVADVALSPSAARRAIEILKLSKIRILGGEVWKREGKRFIPTYDIWNIERSDYLSYEKYTQESLEMATHQVERCELGLEDVFLTLGV